MKAVKINYGLDEPRPPFVPEGESPKCDDDKGTDQRSHRKPLFPEASSQTHHGDRLLMQYLAPDRPDVAEEAAKHPLQELKRSRVVDSDQNRGKCPPLASIKPPEAIKDPVMDFSTPTAISPRTVDTPFPKPQSPEGKTPLPPILPLNSSRDSPPQRRRFPSLTSSLPNILPPHQRRASSDRSVPNPPAQLKQRLSVPSLQPLPSIQSPPSSSAATSPETASNTPLPSISALGLNKSDVAPNANPFGFSQVHYGPPGIATPRESPLDRQLPSLLPPSPYNHFSPVSAISAKDVSNNPSPASQAPTWRTPTSTTTPAGLPPPPPPPPPLPPAPSEHTIPQSPYEMSPMTAKSPATSYPTPTEQIGPTVGGQSTFSANMVHNGVATGAGHYQCDHPGCTAPPFQTQYLLK